MRDAPERAESTAWHSYQPATDPVPAETVARADAADILIAEDHKDLCEYLARLLAGYRVRIARDGADALAQIAEQSPDLAGQRAKLRGLEARADDYLTKPFHPDELLARVRNLLTLREQAKALRQLNQDLKVQVLDQAEALQRRHHLSRFLAPSVVDAVLAGDPKQVLERQRRPRS